MKKMAVLVALWLLAAAPAWAEPAPADYAAVDTSRFKTVAVLEDITDPAHPVELWRGSNLLTTCGVRNLLALGLYADGQNMSLAGSTSGDGVLCAGNNAGGSTMVSCPFSSGSIAIGQGGVSCLGANSPWRCCQTNGVPCTPQAFDLILFAEGQEDAVAQLANQQTAYDSWVSSPTTATNLSFTTSVVNSDTASAYQFVATAGPAVANFPWCEWGVRSQTGAGCGFTNTGNSSSAAGWLLNHAVISGTACTVGKSSGATWQITVTITLS